MRLKSAGPEDTGRIGFEIGRRLKPGDVVALYGDLGAGKTTLVRGMASAFGIPSGDVTSASFTIIAEYPSTPPFLHIDLYRIEREEDLEAIGFWESIGGDSVSVIEWAERIPKEDSAGFIKVRITAGPDDVREIASEDINEEDWNNL